MLDNQDENNLHYLMSTILLCLFDFIFLLIPNAADTSRGKLNNILARGRGAGSYNNLCLNHGGCFILINHQDAACAVLS